MRTSWRIRSRRCCSWACRPPCSSVGGAVASQHLYIWQQVNLSLVRARCTLRSTASVELQSAGCRFDSYAAHYSARVDLQRNRRILVPELTAHVRQIVSVMLPLGSRAIGNRFTTGASGTVVTARYEPLRPRYLVDRRTEEDLRKPAIGSMGPVGYYFLEGVHGQEIVVRVPLKPQLNLAR